MSEIARILTALAVSDQPAALCTLVEVVGSSYRRPGARLLMLADGTRLGSISGGCLEDDVVLRTQRVLESGQPECLTYDTTVENDLVWGAGLGCQGVVRILIEPIPRRRPIWLSRVAQNLRARRDTPLDIIHRGDGPLGTRLAQESTKAPDGIFFREIITAPPSLVVFGAGDDAQPLVRMAKETGWHVTVADARSAYAERARFPQADEIVTAPAEKLGEIPGDETPVFAVIMTHRYSDDLQLLRALLPRPLAYLGLLGPRKRTDRLLAQLRVEGVNLTEEMLEKLHAPVGLDLGGDTPESVALAILAEIHCRRARRTPINLRDRGTPIHG